MGQARGRHHHPPPRNGKHPRTPVGSPPRSARPRPALRGGAFETVDEVEGRLAAVAERAPAPLVRPSLEALTSGGKRLRRLSLGLAARGGGAGRGGGAAGG